MSSGRERRTPGGALTQDRVQNEEQLVHTGRKGDLLGFAGSAQALVEGADDGIVPRGDQRSQVQGRAHPGPSASDDAPAAQRAALTVERGDADEGGDLLAAEPAQRGQLSEQGEGGGRAAA